jgi:hypothetical protein
VACLGVIWFGGARHLIKPLGSRRIFASSIAMALLLGSLTDVILSTTGQRSLPQMAPIFTLLPIMAVCHAMKYYNLMGEGPKGENELILSNETRSKLYVYLAFAFIAGALQVPYLIFYPIWCGREKPASHAFYRHNAIFLGCNDIMCTVNQE